MNRKADFLLNESIPIDSNRELGRTGIATAEWSEQIKRKNTRARKAQNSGDKIHVYTQTKEMRVGSENIRVGY